MYEPLERDIPSRGYYNAERPKLESNAIKTLYYS